MNKHPLIIGIAGGTASGKTTVTQKILDRLELGKVVVLKHDNYYKNLLAGEVPHDSINYDHPDALETSLLIQHVHCLRAWKAIEQPIYNFTTSTREPKTAHIEPRSVVIVEGMLIFWEPELRNLFDIKIYVDADADERLLRRIRRDVLQRGRSVESVMQQYIATVKPMHLEFVEPSMHWADIIIPRGGENTVAIDMVATKIGEMLRKNT